MKKTLSAILFVAMLSVLCSCSKTEKRYTATSFEYFDTVTNIVGYAASEEEFDNTKNIYFPSLKSTIDYTIFTTHMTELQI